MSTNQPTPSFSSGVALPKAKIQKKADALYKSSFADLDDGTIYRDPLGMRANRQVRLQEKMYETRRDAPVFDNGESILDRWDRLQNQGFSVSDTVKQIQKNLDTGDWSLPIDHIPDVYVVNPERTPMADMMARETTQSDVVRPTRVTDDPEMAFGLETTDDTEGSYEYQDPTYADNSFDVVGHGAATRLEDKLILAANQLRNAEQVQQQAFLRGARQSNERQIIQGQANADASGYQGFDDLGTVEADNGDPASPDDNWDDFLRQLIDSAEFAGAPRDSLAVVTDFDTHRDIRSDIVSNVRYNDPDSELMAGFSTLTFDDVPVFKSHAITRTSQLGSSTTSNQMYVVNMESTYLSVLQEASVKPLAKIAPQEQFAVDQYLTLTAEAPSHIRIGTVTTPA